MRTRVAVIAIIFSIIMLFLSGTSFALTTDELVELKKAGVPEDVILYMVDANYNNIDRVLKLKGAGFKDETILTIIKDDLKDKPSPAPAAAETKGEAPAKDAGVSAVSRVKILWYILYKGDTVLQNSEAVDDANMSVSGDSIKFEWKPKGGLGLLDIFAKEAFKPPFYWDINNDDVLTSGKEGYAFTLKSSRGHRGKPDTDGSHYWVVYLDPKDTTVIDYIKGRLLQGK